MGFVTFAQSKVKQRLPNKKQTIDKICGCAKNNLLC
jgi:hypothetical protein